jgi:microcystin degradation protein MlrC
VALGVGNSGELDLGGRADPALGGGPLKLYGRVVSITDGHFPAFGPINGGAWVSFGITMVFRVANNFDIVVISNNGQLLDIAQITSTGIDLTKKKVICVKSKHHFRASLTDLAHEIITVDGGGLGSTILGSNILTGSAKYEFVRRPIWPLDEF